MPTADFKFPPHITSQYFSAHFYRGQLPETFGIGPIEVSGSSLKCSLTVDERHLRPGGIMNGGVSLVMIEFIGSVSSSCLISSSEGLMKGDKNALGLTVTANHTRTAKPGDRLTASSSAVHIGRSTHIWDVTIVNQNDQLVSTGRITMMIVAQ